MCNAGRSRRGRSGKVYARFVNDVVPTMNFSGDTSKSGAFASPSTSIVYMSVLRGLVGGDKSCLAPMAAAPIPIGPKIAGAQIVGGSSQENAHRGDFDPTEFFSTFIGDAKLLGIVRIADILKVAIAASGTRIPTINKEALFDLAEDALRAVMPTIGKGIDDALTTLNNPADVPAAVAARLTPGVLALKAAWQALSNTLSATSVDAAAVLAQLREFGSAAQTAAADANAIASEPELLLPPEAGAAIRELKAIFDALPNLDIRALVRTFIVPAIQRLVSQAIRAQIEAIEQAVADSPEFASLRRALSSSALLLFGYRESEDE